MFSFFRNLFRIGTTPPRNVGFEEMPPGDLPFENMQFDDMEFEDAQFDDSQLNGAQSDDAQFDEMSFDDMSFDDISPENIVFDQLQVELQNTSKSKGLGGPRRSRRLAGKRPQYRVRGTTTPSPPGSPSYYFDMTGKLPPYASTDPRGWSTDPLELDYDEWAEKHSRPQEIVGLYNLTDCRPILVNMIQTIFESNGIFYMWCRQSDCVQEIVSRDLSEIKSILNNQGVGMLNRRMMTALGHGEKGYKLLPRGKF